MRCAGAVPALRLNVDRTEAQAILADDSVDSFVAATSDRAPRFRPVAPVAQFDPNAQGDNDMHGLQSGPGGPEKYNARTPNAIGSAFDTSDTTVLESKAI